MTLKGILVWFSLILSGLGTLALDSGLTAAAEDPGAYFPSGPLEMTFTGLGGKILIHERVSPLDPAAGGRRIEIVRTIRYMKFPERSIVGTFAYDPPSGKVVQNTSTSAFGARTWTFRPPLLQYRLPFRKGAVWEVQDGQNRIHSRVWGKVRVVLPAGTFVCWVVRKRITYDLIRRKSPQILYDYYAPNLGLIAEGGWSDNGHWHWSKKLVSYSSGQ